jgi:hypothetical protein
MNLIDFFDKVAPSVQLTSESKLRVIQMSSLASPSVSISRYWMHSHKQVHDLSVQTTRLTSRPEHHPGSEPPCRCYTPRDTCEKCRGGSTPHAQRSQLPVIFAGRPDSAWLDRRSVSGRPRAKPAHELWVQSITILGLGCCGLFRYSRYCLIGVTGLGQSNIV